MCWLSVWVYLPRHPPLPHPHLHIQDSSLNRTENTVQNQNMFEIHISTTAQSALRYCGDLYFDQIVNNQSNKTHSIFYKLSFPLQTFTVLDRHYENQFKTLIIIHLLNVAFIVYILMCTYHKCYLSFS